MIRNEYTASDGTTVTELIPENEEDRNEIEKMRRRDQLPGQGGFAGNPGVDFSQVVEKATDPDVEAPNIPVVQL